MRRTISRFLCGVFCLVMGLACLFFSEEIGAELRRHCEARNQHVTLLLQALRIKMAYQLPAYFLGAAAIVTAALLIRSTWRRGEKPSRPCARHLARVLLLLVCYLLASCAIVARYGATSAGPTRLRIESNPVGLVWILTTVLVAVALGYFLVRAILTLVGKRPGRDFSLLRFAAVVFLCSSVYVVLIFGVFVGCDVCGTTCVRWRSVELREGWEAELLPGLVYVGAGGRATACFRCVDKYAIQIDGEGGQPP